MATIKLTDKTLRYISLFEDSTKVQVIDCFERGDTIYFITPPGQLPLAIGRNGSNVRRLRQLMNKNIKIIEHSPEPETFIRNIFHGFSILEIRIKDTNDGKKLIAYVSVNPREKGKIIGLESRNLKIAREILNRFTPMDILIV